MKKDIQNHDLENSKIIKKSFFKDKFVPKLLMLPNTTHLSAMRDGLGLLLPITIVGSIGVLIVTFVFGGWGGTATSVLGWLASLFGGVLKGDGGNWSFIEGSSWKTISEIGTAIFGPLKAYTLDCFSLYASFVIAYMIGRIRSLKDPLFAGVIGLASFLIVTRAEKFYFDGTGVFLATFMAMISAEAFCQIVNSKKFEFKMKGNIPPAIVKGFESMIPILMVLVTVGVLDGTSWSIAKYMDINVMTTKANVLEGGNEVILEEVIKFKSGEFGFGGLFIQFISSPMLKMVASGNVGLGIAVFYTLGIGIFWVFGIHGSNMMNIVFWPIFVALVQVNLNLKTMGVPLNSSSYAIWTAGTFDSFIIITGGGITGALVLGILLFGSNFLTEKQICKIAVPAQVFNINEPITFGFPIMFNPKWAIPFVLTMPTASLITYFALKLNIVNPTFILVPWTLPLGVGGLLSTGMDPMGFLLAWINFTAAFLIYLPFILIANKNVIKKMKREGVYESQKTRIREEKLYLKKEKYEQKLMKLKERG